jgi:hypothetical protein
MRQLFGVVLAVHGETGLNVQPDPLMYRGNTTLYADDIPGNGKVEPAVGSVS